jgi:hypothetical protein
MSLLSRLLYALWLLAIPVFGQAGSQNCERKDIAFYNEFAFDSKEGVKRLYQANQAAENEGFISKQRSLSEAKSDYERRYKILVEPVLSDIRQSIGKLAIANDIQIFDAASLDNAGAFLYFDTKLLIDSQLIQFLNVPPEMKRSPPTIKIRPLKIATVNTDRIFDPKTGMRGFELDDLNRKSEFCDGSVKCAEIGKFAANFASEGGFDVILDSSKNPPTEIRNLACKDVTSDFIGSFNRQTVKAQK